MGWPFAFCRLLFPCGANEINSSILETKPSPKKAAKFIELAPETGFSSLHMLEFQLNSIGGTIALKLSYYYHKKRSNFLLEVLLNGFNRNIEPFPSRLWRIILRHSRKMPEDRIF